MSIIQLLRRQFYIGFDSCENSKYAGINLTQNSSGTIGLDQLDYVRSLAEVKANTTASRSSDLCQTDRVVYSTLIGQLNWVATQMRPDLALKICLLISVFEKAKIKDLI